MFWVVTSISFSKSFPFHLLVEFGVFTLKEDVVVTGNGVFRPVHDHEVGGVEV
jgi:hypothetical protein